MGANIKKILISLMFIVAGVVVIVFGSVSNKEIKNFPEVSVTVSDVTKSTVTEADGTISEDVAVRVKYTVDGKEYNELLQSAPTNLSEGDTLTVHYNPEKPSYVTGATKGSNTVMFVIGAAGILIGLAAPVVGIIKKK